MIPSAPGVQMKAIPEDGIPEEDHDEDKDDPDERITQHAKDKNIQRDNEFSDSEDCLLYTSPSPRDRQKSRMPSSA